MRDTTTTIRTVPANAVALLRDVTMGLPIVERLERTDATPAPYGGRFIIHGARAEVLEGPGGPLSLDGGLCRVGRWRWWGRLQQGLVEGDGVGEGGQRCLSVQRQATSRPHPIDEPTVPRGLTPRPRLLVRPQARPR